MFVLAVVMEQYHLVGIIIAGYSFQLANTYTLENEKRKGNKKEKITEQQKASTTKKKNKRREEERERERDPTNDAPMA